MDAPLLKAVHVAVTTILLLATASYSQNRTACTPANGVIAKGNTHNKLYADFTFISRDEWAANPWRNDICSCSGNDTTQMIPLSDPYVITIHHTQIPTQSTSYNESVRKVQAIQQYHQYNINHSWCDIGYHFLVDSAGHVFQGRPFWDDNATLVQPLNTSYKWPTPRLIQGSHALNSNTNNIGIAVIGCYDTNRSNCVDGSDPLRLYDATYTRLVQLVSWICDYYDIVPSNTSIVRHKYWKETSCPGNVLGGKQMMQHIRSDVLKTLTEGTALCYDYTDMPVNGTGGLCKNARLCDKDLIVNTKDDDQCNDLGQICCRVVADHGDSGDGTEKKDMGAIYVLIVILSFVLIVIVIALVLRQRKEWMLKRSVHADLTQNIHESEQHEVGHEVDEQEQHNAATQK